MWFVVGSVVFQIRGIKSFFFTTSSSLFSALSLFLLIYRPSPIIVFMNSIELHLISELLTSLAYLLGANISRYKQFEKNELQNYNLYPFVFHAMDGIRKFSLDI